VKLALGLLNDKRPVLADRNLQKTFGSADHRAVAREAVKKSIVLLKNDHGALPLHKGVRLHVAGKSADDIGNQCGGWTITWQGKSGAITKGTTILQALKKAAPDTQITYSADGSGAAGAKVAIAVIGEAPYAEFEGDRIDLHLPAEDVRVVENLKHAGMPVVAVIVSGRPMVIDPILDKADAIVAAWLPGTEGDGVADVLFGDYKPTGKLSFTWPRGTSTSLHLGDTGHKALYPFGHGLSW
jgi:beta-glucosidase